MNRAGRFLRWFLRTQGWRQLSDTEIAVITGLGRPASPEPFEPEHGPRALDWNPAVLHIEPITEPTGHPPWEPEQEQHDKE